VQPNFLILIISMSKSIEIQCDLAKGIFSEAISWIL
jgi:hypothetical protein